MGNDATADQKQGPFSYQSTPALLRLTPLCGKSWFRGNHGIEAGMITTGLTFFTQLRLSIHHALTLKPHDRFMA